MSQPRIPLGKLRQMRDTVERYAALIRSHADGSFEDGGGGWSDKDEASRSLSEASIYLSGWVHHREKNGDDPKPGT